MSFSSVIHIEGARQHNLKNLTLDIPRDKLVVVCGPSGSGKSTLAFDIVYAEGQRRYVESLSAYARQFLPQLDKPQVDKIEGLSPAISLEQQSATRNPRSTVGTVTEIHDFLRVFFARSAVPTARAAAGPSRPAPWTRSSPTSWPCPRRETDLMAPLVEHQKGTQADRLSSSRPRGSCASGWTAGSRVWTRCRNWKKTSATPWIWWGTGWWSSRTSGPGWPIPWSWP
jgi:excinuclease ABC subunit A